MKANDTVYHQAHGRGVINFFAGAKAAVRLWDTGKMALIPLAELRVIKPCDGMTIDTALRVVSEDIAHIGSKMLLQDSAALSVVSAYAQYSQNPHVVTEELLISAVTDWQERKGES